MVITLFGRELGIMYIISQIFALVALLLNLYAFQRRKKVHLLNFNTVATICSVFHYLFLGAWSGATMKTVSATRNGIAAYEAHVHKTSRIIPLIFVAFYIITGVVTFDSPLAILPVTASVIYTITIYIANVSTIRYAAILASALWLIYDIFVLSIIGVAAEAIFIFDDFIAIYRYRKTSKQKCRHRSKRYTKK